MWEKRCLSPVSITTATPWRRWSMPRFAAASSLKALDHLTGLVHRFQPVLDHNGVRRINDSKATNVGSTEAVLNGLQLDGTLYLLLGGDGKSADLAPAEALPRRRSYSPVPSFGRDGAELAGAASWRWRYKLRLWNRRCVRDCSLVKAGDMVLPSPACASLDQFKNLEQRARCRSVWRRS